jgi:hypothetical protein
VRPIIWLAMHQVNTVLERLIGELWARSRDVNYQKMSDRPAIERLVPLQPGEPLALGVPA